MHEDGEVDSIEIEDFPMPPTSNHVYSTIIRNGMPIRVKAKSLRDYEKACAAFRHENSGDFIFCREFMRNCLQKGLVFNINRYFKFRQHQIYTKKGAIKRLDVTNRIKCLDDQLALHLGIDDRFFWSGSEVKMVGDNEGVDIEITPIDPLKYTEKET